MLLQVYCFACNIIKLLHDIIISLSLHALFFRLRCLFHHISDPTGQMSYATSLPVFTARPHLVACYSHQPNPKPRGSIKPAVRLGKFFTRVSLQLSEETGAPGRLTSLKLSAMMLYEQMDTGKWGWLCVHFLTCFVSRPRLYLEFWRRGDPTQLQIVRDTKVNKNEYKSLWTAQSQWHSLFSKCVLNFNSFMLSADYNSPYKSRGWHKPCFWFLHLDPYLIWFLFFFEQLAIFHDPVTTIGKPIFGLRPICTPQT